MKKEESDLFRNLKIYPNTDWIFNSQLLSINDVKNECIFILDTNVLLLPYSAGSESLSAIKKLFSKLCEEGRLFIPDQAVREFANNRPDKLKDIFQQLSRKHSSIQNLNVGNYPLLGEIEEYIAVIDLERELNDKLKEYRNALNKLTNHVKLWNWNDPVSLMYKEIFNAKTIIDLEIDHDKVRENLRYRYTNKIPPGFKDADKPDEGIGDLLIWLAILDVAKKGKHVIFVSGDEKNDWFHRSEKQALYPRFELISEFLTVSDGKSFHIIRFSEMLNLLGADQTVVKEIAVEESTETNIKSTQTFNSIATTDAWSMYHLGGKIENFDSVQDAINYLSQYFFKYHVKQYTGGVNNDFSFSFQVLIARPEYYKNLLQELKTDNNIIFKGYTYID